MCFKKFLPVIIGLSLISVALSGCKEQNAYAPPPPATVTVSKPEIKDTTYYLYKTGRFSANQDVVVTARVSGVLEQRLFTEGQSVNESDVLFIIEQTAYQAQLDEAKAALNSAYAQNKEAKALLERRKAAFQTKAISEIEVIQAQANYDQSLANIQNAKAMVTSAELNFSYTEVKAPISGRVSRSMVDVGNLVSPSQNAILTTIVDSESLKIYFSVTESELAVYLRDDAPRVEEKTDDNKHRFVIHAGLGQRISSTNGNGNGNNTNNYPFEGQLDFVDNAVDPNTGTILLRGKFENPDKKIAAGMFARIRIPLRVVENALTVPEIALGQNQAGYFIYTVDDQNIVKAAKVDVAFIQEGVAVINSGLDKDATIIINGMSLVQDGRPVNPQTAQPAANPADNADAAPKENASAE